MEVTSPILAGLLGSLVAGLGTGVGALFVFARGRGGSELAAVSTVGGGALLGAVALWLLHALVPHEHFTRGALMRDAVIAGNLEGMK